MCQQVVLRAKRGISYMGDIVIDDVAFVNCAPPVMSHLPCHNNEFICANGHCINEDNLCDFIDHCGDGSDENHYICSKKHACHLLSCHFYQLYFSSYYTIIYNIQIIYYIKCILHVQLGLF